MLKIKLSHIELESKATLNTNSKLFLWFCRTDIVGMALRNKFVKAHRKEKNTNVKVPKAWEEGILCHLLKSTLFLTLEI